MVLVGLLLILACAVVGTDFVIQNTATIHVDFFGQTLNMTPGALFLIGAGVGLVFALGVAMMVDSTRRRSRVRDTHRENAALRERNAELEADRTDSRAYPNDPVEDRSWSERRGWRGRHRDRVS